MFVFQLVYDWFLSNKIDIFGVLITCMIKQTVEKTEWHWIFQNGRRNLFFNFAQIDLMWITYDLFFSHVKEY